MSRIRISHSLNALNGSFSPWQAISRSSQGCLSERGRSACIDASGCVETSVFHNIDSITQFSAHLVTHLRCHLLTCRHKCRGYADVPPYLEVLTSNAPFQCMNIQLCTGIRDPGGQDDAARDILPCLNKRSSADDHLEDDENVMCLFASIPTLTSALPLRI